MLNVKYETRYGDCKNFDMLKPTAILDIVQDISTNDSSSRGYGLHKLREMGIAWLLQGVTVHFEKPVKPILPLEVFTAVKRMKGATSERGCIIKQEGEIVAKTIANWFTFDANEKKLCRIPEDMISAYESYDFNDDFFTFRKPALYKIESCEYKVKVSNRDIDTNMHLNNEKGAEILTDALPFDFYFNNMNIIYKKSAYLGDVLEVCIKKTENGYYVHLQTEEKELCVAGVFENI